MATFIQVLQVDERDNHNPAYLNVDHITSLLSVGDTTHIHISPWEGRSDYILCDHPIEHVLSLLRLAGCKILAPRKSQEETQDD